ncbi:MAG TPA: hypothetical protein VFD22_01145, partial [Gemmatimonadaceae bacterium]|nr:hypothetical protein [Gemmatimonadaceae bacterium]
MMTELRPHALAEMIEFYEAAAYAEVYRAAPVSLEFTAEESGDCVAFFAPEFDMLMFNRALGVGLKEAASKDLIESLTARYRER